MRNEPERERRHATDNRQQAAAATGLLDVLWRIVGGHNAEILVMDRDGRVSRVEPRQGSGKR
jgi:hypothetical protein